MATSDHHSAKRRRLGQSNSLTRLPVLNTSKDWELPSFREFNGNIKSMRDYTDNGNNLTANGTRLDAEGYAPQQHLQVRPVMMDNVCTTSTVPNGGAETVCFGMLALSIALSMTGTNDGLCCPLKTALRLGSNGTLQYTHVDSNYGVLSTRDAQLLDLFSREGVELELMCVPSLPKRGVGAEEKAAVWATLYGTRDLAPDLCHLFDELQLYLQDPIHALRDAAYFNPQRFFHEPDIRTSHFQAACPNGDQILTVKNEDVIVTDLLDGLTAKSTLHETPGSAYLLTELMSHQKQGLTFMIRRESDWKLHDTGSDVWSQASDSFGHVTYINNINSSIHYTQPASFRGGLVADLMGLGKTLAMISLIAHDKVLGRDVTRVASNGKTLGRGTLLVLPPSLLHNWEEELSKHLSADHFAWQRHHGRQRIRDTSDVLFHDIVLTTYTTLANEWQNQEQSPVFSHEWHRIILDEAHEIKDLSTSKARAACALKARCRWAVTGTPIQNRLSELFSLFHFLRLNPYGEKRAFDECITNPWLRGEERGLQALVKLLGYIMLRRSKNTIVLPLRSDHRRFLKLSVKDQDAYDATKLKAVEYLDNALTAPKLQDSYRNALQKINALRVICELGCSPKLYLQTALTNSTGYGPFLTPGTPDGCSTPNTILDEEEDENNGVETEKDGDMDFRLEECFPSHTTLRTCLSPFPANMPVQPPLYPDQWPTKIQALLEDLQSCPVGTKSVVFSYRKSILDVANTALRSVGIGCVQIDGKSKASKRIQDINAFSKKDAVQVLLLSLGCGAVGLTLTAASRAYLLEPQWNPSVEEQALARIHRLGQTQEGDDDSFCNKRLH